MLGVWSSDTPPEPGPARITELEKEIRRLSDELQRLKPRKSP